MEYTGRKYEYGADIKALLKAGVPFDITEDIPKYLVPGTEGKGKPLSVSETTKEIWRLQVKIYVGRK